MPAAPRASGTLPGCSRERGQCQPGRARERTRECISGARTYTHPAASRTSSSRRARCAETTTDDVRDLRGAASSGANGPAELLRRGVLMLKRWNASACTGSASFMPAMLKLLMRPSALDIGATISSSGSAARRRAKGMPITSLSTTAEPEGASMASCSSSSWKRQMWQSGSPGATEKPASGVRSRCVMWRRSRASSAYPSAAPPFIRPNKMMTTCVNRAREARQCRAQAPIIQKRQRIPRTAV